MDSRLICTHNNTNSRIQLRNGSAFVVDSFRVIATVCHERMTKTWVRYRVGAAEDQASPMPGGYTAFESPMVTLLIMPYL